jgi:hypothetical protein
MNNQSLLKETAPENSSVEPSNNLTEPVPTTSLAITSEPVPWLSDQSQWDWPHREYRDR